MRTGDPISMKFGIGKLHYNLSVAGTCRVERWDWDGLLYQTVSGGTEKTLETLARTAGAAAEHKLRTDLDCYCYRNLIGIFSFIIGQQ